MKITDTEFSGLKIIEPAVYKDNRGYFFESYNENSFNNLGLGYRFVQDNESSSAHGVVRGLHYQIEPFAQAKLVRVVSGRIFDVALDLRKNSPNFGKWFGTELSALNKLQLLIPKGFAHGFSVLSGEATVIYKCDNIYNKDYERGIRFNDTEIGIDWKTNCKNIIVSEKDAQLPPFREAEFNFTFE